jgi:hypothetical protein
MKFTSSSLADRVFFDGGVVAEGVDVVQFADAQPRAPRRRDYLRYAGATRAETAGGLTSRPACT